MTELTKLHARRMLAALVLLALAFAGQARSENRAVAATQKRAASKMVSVPSAAVGAPATIATVGSRKITDLDILRAAAALEDDPLRKRDPAAWRRMLLDRCVDRELLAMEAASRGLDKDPAIAARLANREFLTLDREVYQRVVIPGVAPTPEQLREVRAEGLNRMIDLHFIYIRDNAIGARRSLAQYVYEKAKAGARFDSLAKIYSEHPQTRAAGGHFGWILAKDLDTLTYEDLRRAKVGDVIGVYSGNTGHQIYKLGAFRELSDDSLQTMVGNDRKLHIARDYENSLLAKYHFAIDPTQVRPLVLATGSETADSILASLGPDGTRPDQAARPALGILARCDGDSVTFPDILRAMPSALAKGIRLKVRNAQDVHDLCARAVVHKLTVRDAKERGIDKDFEIARELRLSRDQTLTQAMVERNSAAPDDAALRAMVEARPDHYRRPRATVARVAMFSKPDSAALARSAWTGAQLTDSLLEIWQLRPWPRAGGSLFAGWYDTVTLLDGDSDALTRAVAGV